MSTLKIKRGLNANVGSLTLQAGEPAFTLDTHKLYIGDGTVNTIINPDIVPAAIKLSTTKNFSITGDVTAATVAFDGTTDIVLSAALPNVGTAGTYFKVTTDAKGRVNSGAAALIAADIPSLDYTKITTGKPTTIAGYGITDPIALTTGHTMTGVLTLAADPISPLQAATKQYVDAAIQGLDVKAAVRVATTGANITLATGGLAIIDGVTTVDGDRVLVKDQTLPAENGIYIAHAGAWIRSIDADASVDMSNGLFTFVEQGTANANSGYVMTITGPITLGTTALLFSQFSGAGQITASTGLTKVGNVISITNTGVTAGQYTKLTVNAQGQVTTATNLVATDIPVLDWSKITTGKPTTIAGYGLTDAAPLASPALTGTPTAPTAATATNTTQIATTAFVKAQAYATLASPALTGTPTAPTALTADNSTTIATTAYVQAQAYLIASSVIDGGTF